MACSALASATCLGGMRFSMSAIAASINGDGVAFFPLSRLMNPNWRGARSRYPKARTKAAAIVSLIHRIPHYPTKPLDTTSGELTSTGSSRRPGWHESPRRRCHARACSGQRDLSFGARAHRNIPQVRAPTQSPNLFLLSLESFVDFVVVAVANRVDLDNFALDFIDHSIFAYVDPSIGGVAPKLSRVRWMRVGAQVE